ncbi:MAG TPA: MFS transporter [Steroidobacteraceae bacterium]|nr:MFS transporter [Steroidobacteraceae bacterium]
MTTEAAPPTSFAALRHPGFRMYFVGTATAMLADNIEHVISYWAMFQKFHSPALGGFAVISHWTPFLLLSIYSGALADRFDPRRIIQIGMLLFVGVSLAWGVLFLTDSLQEWHARILLIIHGVAGVLWGPAGQLLLHDIVGPEELQSAVRLGATARYLGMLTGPAVGGALLLALGPAHGIILNSVIYLPMILWLWKAPYGPKFRRAQSAPAVAAPAVSSAVAKVAPGLREAPARTVRGWGDLIATFRSIGEDSVVLSMMLLAGITALFIGNAYQAQMPGFAQDLGHGNPGAAYSMLLAADACGALIAGFILESRGLLKASPRTAIILALCWCAALGFFAHTSIYPLALLLLFAAGFLELSYNSMAQALVQLSAPVPIRGRVIGVFTMATNGMRLFSGITVGILGGILGIHRSLPMSAIVLFFALIGLLVITPGTQSAAPDG